MSFTEKSFQGLNSRGFHRIVYNDWGAPGAHTVVAVHGLTCNGHDFDDLAENLVGQGYRFIAVDLPGRGRSDNLPNPADYHLGQYCQDIAALFAHLGLNADSKIDWIGTSLGGLLGMCISAMPGTPVKRLLINDVGPEISAEILSFLHQVILKPRSFETLQEIESELRSVQRIGWGPLSGEQWSHMTRHYARPAADGSLTFNYDQAIAENFAPAIVKPVDLWPYWQALAQPTMIIRGGQSLLLTQAVAERMLGTRPEGMTQLVTFDDCGHAPSLLAPAHMDVIRQWLNAKIPV